MQLTYYGHSCFAVLANGKKLLFDPYITPNEQAKHIDISSIQPDYILLSHGHGDHIADCIAIAQQSGCMVICSWEIYLWLGEKGITNVHPMNAGGKKQFDFGTVKCVTAQHSSGLPDGSYGGHPLGFIVYAGNETFYYSGDTALTLDMQLIPRWASLQFAVMPIGDNFTMDVQDALTAADFIQCDTIVGVHYNTFDIIKIDTEKAQADFEAAGKRLLLPRIGDTIDV
ncbi:MAG TPA: metal-dependent hydrolase [Chitinophagaceae bacterium]|nr:metal-dependent hydrolase [Chitinophagaceae bacterium]